MVHSICDSYPKFGAAAPRQTGVITRRKKWGRLTPPPPANAGLTRQTWWYQIRCSIVKIKDFIVEKPFWKILEFWPLETPILTWAKKWPKWFRNDFSRAFERCLSFFSTATRSRDHGGGAFKRPPPPAGGGKSRGPAGRGLISLEITTCHY